MKRQPLGDFNILMVKPDGRPAEHFASWLHSVDLFMKAFANINPIAQPPFPATGVTVTNTTGQIVAVFIQGGNVTAITINGTAVSTNATNMVSVTLMPGDTIALTYTGSPIWNWRVFGI